MGGLITNLVTIQIIFQVVEIVLEILTITLDVLKLWSLSEKLFHINLICPSFSSSKLLLHCSGFDWSDRSVQRQFPEDPLSELSWNFRWTSEVPIIHRKFQPVLLLICIILRLFWLEVIMGWYDNCLWPMWSIVNVIWDYNFTQRMC